MNDEVLNNIIDIILRKIYSSKNKPEIIICNPKVLYFMYKNLNSRLNRSIQRKKPFKFNDIEIISSKELEENEIRVY